MEGAPDVEVLEVLTELETEVRNNNEPGDTRAAKRSKKAPSEDTVNGWLNRFTC
jgi:hypothetical protein